MSTFTLNLALAIAWVALTEDVTPANFVIGAVLGFLVIGLADFQQNRQIGYFTKVGRFISFTGFFLYELTLANLRVAYEVLVPPSMQTMNPGIIAVPLDISSDDEITLMANFITLTPGTLSMDVSPDRKTLYVHTLHVDDYDEFIQDLKDQLERRVAEVLS